MEQAEYGKKVSYWQKVSGFRNVSGIITMNVGL